MPLTVSESGWWVVWSNLLCVLDPRKKPHWPVCIFQGCGRDNRHFLGVICKAYMELKDKLFTSLENNHVIGVCLLSQSEPEKHNKGKKGPHTFAHLKQMCRPCLIIIQSCYFDCRINKPFAYSRCLVCISCSVHVISTYHVRKGSCAFFLSSLPTSQGGQKIRSHGSGAQLFFLFSN